MYDLYRSGQGIIYAKTYQCSLESNVTYNGTFCAHVKYSAQNPIGQGQFIDFYSINESMWTHTADTSLRHSV